MKNEGQRHGLQVDQREERDEMRVELSKKPLGGNTVETLDGLGGVGGRSCEALIVLAIRRAGQSSLLCPVGGHGGREFDVFCGAENWRFVRVR